MTEESKPKITIRTMITDECIKCKHTEMYDQLIIEPDAEEPPKYQALFIGASPLCVVIAELKSEERNAVLFYRCVNRECLLKHLREAMIMNFVQSTMMQEERNMQQSSMMAMSRHKTAPSRKSNKRRKAKENSKKVTIKRPH